MNITATRNKRADRSVNILQKTPVRGCIYPGRFPGSRVIAERLNLPGHRLTSGLFGRPLSAHSCGGSLGLGGIDSRPHRVPS